MKRRCMGMGLRYWSLRIFSVLLTALLIVSCSQKKENRPLSVSNLVQTAQVTRRNFNRILTSYGYVRPLQKTDIVAYTRGRITNIWVREGEKVEKGQRLLSLEGYYSTWGVEEPKSFSKKELVAPGKDIIKIAPVSGYVTQLTKNIGSRVEEGEILLSIVDLKKLLAEVEVFGTEANSIKPGQSAVITSDESRFSGEVSFIATGVDPETGGRKVGIEIFQQEAKRLLPGDFVKADIIVEKHLSSLAIPEKALLNDGGQNVVMVKVGQAYEKRPIVVGLYNQGYAEVLKGLREGEEVVTVGAYELLNRGIKEKIKVED
jgi:multidrug efflux pump subunit AcrA (membrane-fusion protein)